MPPHHPPDPRGISIHSPRMGRDGEDMGGVGSPADFNPLSPHGERPHGSSIGGRPLAISIHSPRMGRDGVCRTYGRKRRNFNPLSPHGERQQPAYQPAQQAQFQSTLPAWGETNSRKRPSTQRKPRFQSTLPAWGETIRLSAWEEGEQFQSTLPAWGETSAADG